MLVHVQVDWCVASVLNFTGRDVFLHFYLPSILDFLQHCYLSFPTRRNQITRVVAVIVISRLAGSKVVVSALLPYCLREQDQKNRRRARFSKFTNSELGHIIDGWMTILVHEMRGDVLTFQSDCSPLLSCQDLIYVYGSLGVRRWGWAWQVILDLCKEMKHLSGLL